MLPRLQAEEDVRWLNLALASEGRMMPEGAREKFVQEIEARINELELPEARPATEADLTAIGIKVKHV